MSSPSPITLTLDRRLLEHPRALHLRRMRQGLWLYLDLLARLPTGAGSLEVEPKVVGEAMGLPEGQIRSWLGHLRKAGYIEAERLNGRVRVTVKRSVSVAEPVDVPRQRFFTVPKLQHALGDAGNRSAFEAALKEHSDVVIRKALAGALAMPAEQIRRSRTALFLYLLNRYAHAQEN
jgi:hypothetical protein